jgi:hypothetical protein
MQLLAPFSELCAFDNCPGEICPTAVGEKAPKHNRRTATEKILGHKRWSRAGKLFPYMTSIEQVDPMATHPHNCLTLFVVSSIVHGECRTSRFPLVGWSLVRSCRAVPELGEDVRAFAVPPISLDFRPISRHNLEAITDRSGGNGIDVP